MLERGVPLGAVLKSGPRGPRSTAALLALALALGVAFIGFIGLGTWQVERRAWKLALIERVDRRVHALPDDAPSPAGWAGVNAAADEYRHVRIRGRFLPVPEARVQAVTDRGPGFWVLAPIRAEDGSVVLVNRGFVAADAPRAPPVDASGSPSITVTGLLRMSEPGGGFLRHNDPAADRWYSRDVRAIAAARGLGAVAPYFVDADATPEGRRSGSDPIGGLTVVSFHNSHLVYALTWYTLALLVAWAGWHLAREERRLRQPFTERPTTQ